MANYRILHNVRNAVSDLVSGIYCNSSFKPHRYANCLSEICKNLIILFTFFHRRGSRLSHQLKAKMSSCVVCPFSEPKALQLAYARSCRHMQQSLGKACLLSEFNYHEKWPNCWLLPCGIKKRYYKLGLAVGFELWTNNAVSQHVAILS